MRHYNKWRDLALENKESLGMTAGPPVLYDIQDRIDKLEKDVKSLSRKVDLFLHQSEEPSMRIAS